MKTSKVGLALLLVCCAWAVLIVTGCAKDEVDTTGTIYGIVNDADNGEPVSGVYVVLNPRGKTTNTGSDGRFEFLDMEPGQYTIQISKNGYKTNTKRISVVAGEQASGDMVLERGESRIKLSTNSLAFAKEETSKTFDVMNIGTSGSVSWSVTFTESWLKVTPVNGMTAQGKNSTGYIVKVGNMAPDFTVTLTDGKSVSLSALRGKVVMLQFTASWCGVCRKEMPFIEKDIWLKHKNNPEFALIGIDRDEPLDKVLAFAKTTGVTYPLGLDPGADIFAKYALRNSGITRNVLIDREGKIVKLTRLYDEEEFASLVRQIDEMLKK